MNYGKQHTDGSRSGGQPVNEPVWIEHDGSAVCPVPVNHDIEVRFLDGGTERHGGRWYWGKSEPSRCTITHYRDWTAFAKEQEAMGKDDVGDAPVWAWKRADELRGPCETYHNAFARYIAAHEQPPVDWLQALVGEVVENAIGEFNASVYVEIAAMLRNRIPNIDSLANAAGGGE